MEVGSMFTRSRQGVVKKGYDVVGMERKLDGSKLGLVRNQIYVLRALGNRSCDTSILCSAKTEPKQEVVILMILSVF
jgi:hypothetical protein